SPDFVESTDLLENVSRVVVIDHHRMMVRHIENALVFYHEPFASSASEMVTELVQYIGDRELGEPEAEALLAGIMLDTKNFVLKTGVRTFEAAAYLRRKDADTVRVKRLFSDSIDAYKAKYKIVSNAQLYGDYAVASAEAEFPDIRISAAQAADELLSIEGVNASFVVYPAGGVVNLSARSLGEVNVQLVMEQLGGGGHLTMAGAQLSGVTVKEAVERLISAIRKTAEKRHSS
ncbi:MAG: DHHA1 domain-containing protein, partial [Oscillospiraceae bacterium]|nr:DHHA1 domain-containing protein [Oscillospiraceae bacterium]